MEAGPTGRMEGQADTQPGSPVPRACGGVARWAQRGMGVAGWWAWQGRRDTHDVGVAWWAQQGAGVMKGCGCGMDVIHRPGRDAQGVGMGVGVAWCKQQGVGVAWAWRGGGRGVGATIGYGCGVGVAGVVGEARAGFVGGQAQQGAVWAGQGRGAPGLPGWALLPRRQHFSCPL